MLKQIFIPDFIEFEIDFEYIKIILIIIAIKIPSTYFIFIVNIPPIKCICSLYL